MKTLWVVDPSLNTSEDQGVETVLADWQGEHRLFHPALRPGDGPEPSTGYDADAIVVMGSAASVHDRLPWLNGLSAWLQPVVSGERSIPLLGLCFGHQLIAHLAGAQVADLAGDKRVGVERSKLRNSLLLPARESLRVVVSHREIVAVPPPGYRVTAERTGVKIDGLEHERLPIRSYQFHPEAREEFAERVGIDREEIDAALRSDSSALIAAFLDSV